MKARNSTSPENKQRLYKLLAITNGICYLCGQPLSLDDVTLDHIVPKSLGGGNEHINKLPTHSVCNRMKADMTYEQFILQCSIIVNNAVRNMVYSEMHQLLNNYKNRQANNNTNNDKAKNKTPRNPYPKRNVSRRIEETNPRENG